MTAELRRAEANHHNVDALLPRLIAAHGFADADDIASAIHHRLANATIRPAGSGRTRQAPRLIAGLIPEATGTMRPEARQALAERCDLIEARADALLDAAIAENAAWVAALNDPPKQARAGAAWWQAARTIAAYRDRYGITGPTPLGTPGESAAQKIEAARARAAVDRAKCLNWTPDQAQERPRSTPVRQL